MVVILLRCAALRYAKRFGVSQGGLSLEVVYLLISRAFPAFSSSPSLLLSSRPLVGLIGSGGGRPGNLDARSFTELLQRRASFCSPEVRL